MMSLGTIQIVVSKSIKMEEAARREDYVTQHNSHSWFRKVLRWRKSPSEKMMSLSMFHIVVSKSIKMEEAVR